MKGRVTNKKYHLKQNQCRLQVIFFIFYMNSSQIIRTFEKNLLKLILWNKIIAMFLLKGVR